jgi:hypothetical protein
VGSRSISDSGAGSNPRTIVIDETDTRDTTDLYPLAVDFLGTDLVRLWLEVRLMTGYIGHEERVRNDPGGGGSIAVNEDHSYEWPLEYEVTVKHSLYGDLLNDEQLRHYTTTYTKDPGVNGVADYPGNAVPVFSRVSFVGNLARDVFAFGYATGDGQVTASATTSPEVRSGGDIFATTTRQTTVRPMTYRIWMAGSEQATGQTGSFPNDAVATGSAVSVSPMVSLDLIVNSYLAGSMGSAPTSGTTVTANGNAYNGNLVSGGLAGTPVWQHIAVNAERTVAYLAINHTSAGGGSVPAMKYGLEIAAFNWPDAGGFALDTTVPNYSQAGTVYTLSAPVFPGITRKELVP